jgi:hypothetical protein
MKLHQRGVDLLLNIQDAMQHPEALSAKDVRDLLAEMDDGSGGVSSCTREPLPK